MNYKLRLFYLITLIFTFQAHLRAQGTISFSSDQGLSNTRLRTFYEDNHQNVWISTRNGINRFDGHKMNSYYHDTDNPHSIADNSGLEFINFDDENILIATGRGLQLYNYATDQFYTIPLIQGKDTVERSITHLHRFSDGEIHVCVANTGSFIIDYDGSNDDKPIEKRGICAKYTNDYTFENSSPRIVIEDKQSHLWVITERHELFLRDKGETYKISGINNATYMCEGSRGVYIATTDGKLLRTQPLTHTVETLSTDLGIISTISYSGNGPILICTDGEGLKFFNEFTGEVTQSGIKTNEYDLATSNVKCAMFDHKGNLWIGIYWKGIVIQPHNSALFKYIGRRSALFNSIGTNCVTAILPSADGWMWVATDHGGLYHLSPFGNTSEHWGPGETANTPTTITAIYDDGHGSLWLGSSIGGLTKFNKASHQFSPTALGINNIYSICQGQDESMWIGTMGDAVYYYNPRTGELIHYAAVYDTTQPKESRRIHNSYVNALSIIDDKLYVGTADGLEAFTISNGKQLTHIYQCINGSNVNCIRADNKGTLWAGTTKGLAQITEKNNSKDISIKFYNTKDGLPNDVVNAIEVINNNRGNNYQMWLSTDNGLTLFDPEKATFTNFYSSDGLQGNEFSRGASVQAYGQIYFGGINGLTVFSSSAMHNIDQEHTSPDTLRIIDFYVNDRSVHSGQKSGSYTMFEGWISNADRIDLCNSDNTFTIEVSTMNLETAHISYEYQVNDGEWTATSDESGRIKFINLSPGTYDINIRAISYNQQTPVRSIRVVVHQPWFNSIWAWMIYILLALALAHLAMRQVRERRKAKKILEKHRQVELLNEMRMQFFMNISHEIRTPMTLIKAPLERLKKMDTDEQHQRNYSLIDQNSNRILQLINQLMDVRKIEKGQFHLHYSRVELVGFLSQFIELFTETAQSKGIQLSFEHTGIDLMSACVDKDNFDKIIMNLLSNAFKFTPDNGKVTLSLEENIGDVTQEPLFIIKVTDNGIGIPDEKKAHIFDRFYQVDKTKTSNQANQGGTGIGLNLASLLAQLHEGKLTVCDNPEGQGTQFILTMPQANYLVEDEMEEATVPETSTDKPADEVATVTKMADEGKARTILIVDDESSIREYVTEELAAHLPKYTIQQFSNGRTAWEYLQRSSTEVALVISDIMMPEMDGNQLCHNLKQSFLTNHIPIILLTAKVTEQEKIEGLDIGADAYITKPFSMDLVATTVENLISNRRRLRSKYENIAQEEQKIENIDLVSPDEQLMQRVMKIINENLNNQELSVEFIAREVGLSRVHFHRKLKELTNETPRDFIRGIRLRQAARLLAEKNLDIGHVADACGFRSISTFSTTFKSVYGVSPKDYKKQE